MKRILAMLAMVFAAGVANAQGVGINTTGAAADTSAILDVSSTTKGLLVPRLTAAQRAAIVLPATGLVVYQTDGTTGLYWNAGTPAAPSWKVVGEAGAGGGGGQWSTSGSNIYYTAGRVAVGTTPSQFRFAAEDTGTVFRVQASNAKGLLASFGGTGQILVDAPNVPGGRLTLLGNGNLGLGVTNPTSKLSFAPSLGKKISLYPSGTSDYGLGVANSRLMIYSDGYAGGDVAIGTDNAGTFTERFAVKNNGALAVGGSTGTAGQVLKSNGSGSAAAWGNGTGLAFDNCREFISTGEVTVSGVESGASTVPVPGLNGILTLSGNARVFVNVNVQLNANACAFCGRSRAYVEIWVNGNRVRDYHQDITNDYSANFDATPMLNLGAGSHNIEVRVGAGGPAVTAGYYGGGLRSTMTWQVVPQ